MSSAAHGEEMSPEEIEAFPHKNVIVRALGMKLGVEVDVVAADTLRGEFGARVLREVVPV